MADTDAMDAINQLVYNAVNRMAHDIERKAKQKCPVKTGTLRRSIETQIEATENGAEAVVGSALDYAPYVHEGTGIFSRTGSGRQDVPWRYYSAQLGRWVTTSGIEGTPFLEDAAQEVLADINSYFGGLF